MIESAEQMVWLYRQPLGQGLNRMSKIIPETQIACLNEIEISCFALNLWCSLDGHDSQLRTDGVKVGIKAKGLLVSRTGLMVVFFVLPQLPNTILMISLHTHIPMPTIIVFSLHPYRLLAFLTFITRWNRRKVYFQLVASRAEILIFWTRRAMIIPLIVDVLLTFAADEVSVLDSAFGLVASWAAVQLFLIFVHVSPLLLLASENPDPVRYYFVILVSGLENVDVCQFEFVLLLFGQLNVGAEGRQSAAGVVACVGACLLPWSGSQGKPGARRIA